MEHTDIVLSCSSLYHNSSQDQQNANTKHCGILRDKKPYRVGRAVKNLCWALGQRFYLVSLGLLLSCVYRNWYADLSICDKK